MNCYPSVQSTYPETNQAAVSFKLWTNVHARIEILKAAMMKENSISFYNGSFEGLPALRG